MIKSLFALSAIAFCSLASAQMSPVGRWNTVDDKTGEIKSEVRIVDNAGVLTGSITKFLKKDSKPDAVCDLCSDDRKDKLILGMQIIRGAKKSDGKEVWEGGKVLDPENGKTYTLKLTPLEDGKKLEVRGYIGPFSRPQTWLRVE